MTVDPDRDWSRSVTRPPRDLATLLLGETYHPGGPSLSRRLFTALDVRPGQLLVDVAAGVGNTALRAATEYEAEVDGVDPSASNVALAAGAAAAQGLDHRVAFQRRETGKLPLPDGRYDVALCEAALSTFPDLATAVAEMARVLRPGGRIGITDVTVDRDRLPRVLTGIGGRIACIASARSSLDYEALLVFEGLRVTVVEQHPEALERMLLQIAARTELLRLTEWAAAERAGLRFERVPAVIKAARDALETGALGFGLIVAEKLG